MKSTELPESTIPTDSVVMDKVESTSDSRSKLQKKVIELVSNDSMPTIDTATQRVKSDTTTQRINATVPIDQISVEYLSSMLAAEDCESGISNPSEYYFRDLLEQNNLSALNVIMKVFMDNFATEGRRVNILVGALHLLSHFQYEMVYPFGQTIAMNAFLHKNREVLEYGIKCFENWRHPDGVIKLSSLRFSTDWLQEYADKVILELNEGD